MSPVETAALLLLCVYMIVVSCTYGRTEALRRHFLLARTYSASGSSDISWNSSSLPSSIGSSSAASAPFQLPRLAASASASMSESLLAFRFVLHTQGVRHLHGVPRTIFHTTYKHRVIGDVSCITKPGSTITCLDL